MNTSGSTFPFYVPLVAAIVTCAMGCSAFPKSTKGTAHVEQAVVQGSERNASSSAEQEKQLDITAFVTTLYPILKTNCAGCHQTTTAPKIAASEVDAYAAVVDTQKVNLASPAKSRVYLRVTDDKHNCWSDCKKDGEEILAAINEWAALSATDAITGPRSAEFGITDVVETAPAQKEPGTITVEAEQGRMEDNMTSRGLTDASGGRYALTPNEAVASDLIDDPCDSTDILRYRFNVEEAGAYRFFGKFSAPTVDDDEIYISFDGGVTFDQLLAPPTADNTFAWIEANDNGDQLPILNLQPGPFEVELRRLEAGLKLDVMSLTTNPQFTGTNIVTSPAVTSLSVDVGALCNVPGANLVIDMKEHNDQSYLLRKPRIVSPTPLHVKGLRVFVNGVYYPQYSTYSLVETDIAADSATILSEAGMIILIDESVEKDRFAFAFDDCRKL